MDPKISIIILNWKGWEDTLECLESIYQLEYSNYDIILIDNDSKDESIKKIKDYCEGKIGVKSNYLKYDQKNKPINLFEYTKEEVEKNGIENEYYQLGSNEKLILIKNDKNYGFAEGNNVGIRYSLKVLNPDYILLLNNDTIIDKFLLNKLVFAQKMDEQVVITQAKLLNYNNPKILDSTGGILDKYGFGNSRGSEEIDNRQYDKLTKSEFFYALGTCVLFSKEFILEVNPQEFLDARIFATHDDVDICWLARLLGHEVMYYPEALCYHKIHKSFKKKPSAVVNYLSLRNSIRVLVKNYSTKNLIIYVPAAIIIELIYSLGMMIFYKNVTPLKVFIKAVIWNIRNLRDTMQKRREVQSKRVINDQEIVKYMFSNSRRLATIVEKVRNLF